MKNGTLYCLVFLLFICSCYGDNLISLYALIVLSVLQFLLITTKMLIFKKVYSLDTGCLFSGLKNFQFASLLIFGIWLIASMVVTRSFNYSYPRIFLIIANGFAFTELFSFKEFGKSFTNLLSLICLVSLFLFIINILFGEFSTWITSDSTPFTFAYYGFFFQILGLNRNSAVFWEPGIFGTFCIFGIAICCLFSEEKKRTRLIKIGIFFLGLFSTFSLASFILVVFLPPLFIEGFLKKKHKRFLLIYSSVIFLTLFSILVFPSIFVSLPFIAEKGASLTTRIYAILLDIEIFTSGFKQFLFGVGTDYDHIFSQLADLHYPGLVDSSLNTFGFYFASYGLAGVIVIGWFVLSFFRVKRLSFYSKIYLFIICFAIACKEPHILSTISFCLLFYLLKNGDNKMISSSIFDSILASRRVKENHGTAF